MGEGNEGKGGVLLSGEERCPKQALARSQAQEVVEASLLYSWEGWCRSSLSWARRAFDVAVYVGEGRNSERQVGAIVRHDSRKKCVAFKSCLQKT